MVKFLIGHIPNKPKFQYQQVKLMAKVERFTILREI